MKRRAHIGIWLLLLILVGALSPQAALAQEIGAGPPDGRAAVPGSSVVRHAPKAADTKPANRSPSTGAEAQQPVTGMPGGAPSAKAIGPKASAANPPQVGISGTGVTRIGSGPAAVGGLAKANAGINGSTIKLRR